MPEGKRNGEQGAIQSRWVTSWKDLERDEPLLCGRESNICQEVQGRVVLIQDNFVPQRLSWGYPTTLTEVVVTRVYDSQLSSAHLNLDLIVFNC